MVTSLPFLRARVVDDNDFLRLKEMVRGHEDWNEDYARNDMRIWTKTNPDESFKIIKVWAVFSTVSSTDLFSTLIDPSYRREWDSHMLLTFDIGYLNPNNVISYYSVAPPPPLKKRDFVLQTSWLDRGSEHFILSHSVCHKDYPPKTGFIRAISYMTGYFIKCIPYNGCEVSFVSQTDPQGFIPAWIVNKVTQIVAPKFVKQLEKAAIGYREWKSQNNPQFLPWVHPDMLACPKITVEDCLPSEEEFQGSFFKFLAEKSQGKTTMFVRDRDQKPTAKFSITPETLASSSKVQHAVCPPPVPKGSNLNNGQTSKVDPDPELKPKKSKKSWLDYTKICFSHKNQEL